MIANAPKCVTPPGIEYTLTPTKQGWRLTVWEEAAVTKDRVRPFLWKFGVELETLNEADSILRDILGNKRNSNTLVDGGESREYCASLEKN